MSHSWSLTPTGIIAVCAKCGQKNRVPYQKAAETGDCGQCHQPLSPPSLPLDIDSEATFQSMISQSALPLLIDFWAPWCGPCRMVGPEMEKVAASHSGQWLVAKVNTEALPGLGQRCQVSSIPLMAVFADGKELARSAGARPAAAIEQFVQQSLRP